MKKITDIPWNQLTTPYGRGTKIPKYLMNNEFKKIANLVEHQSTLWQVTPWTIYFLLEKIKATRTEDISIDLLDIFYVVCGSCDEYQVKQLSNDEIVSHSNELLNDEVLWDDDEENDEVLWGEETPRGYSNPYFSSYWYYSYQFMKDEQHIFKRIMDETLDEEIARDAEGIYQFLSK